MVEVIVEIEKPSGDLYYPKIPELTITKSIPYNVDSATIRVAEPSLDISNISIKDDTRIFLDDELYFAGELKKRVLSSSSGSSHLEFPISDYGNI